MAKKRLIFTKKPKKQLILKKKTHEKEGQLKSLKRKLKLRFKRKPERLKLKSGGRGLFV